MNGTGWRSNFLLSIFVILLFLCSAAAGQTCATDAFSGVVDSGDQADTNTNLNVYAAIFLDSYRPAGTACNAAAAYHLKHKLANTYGVDPVNPPQVPPNPPAHQDMLQRSVPPFNGWLEGAYVTYIFPTAIRLNQDGLLSSDPALQTLLQMVANSMNSLAARPSGVPTALTSIDGACGMSATQGAFANTCMDDYSIAAAGFAWAAAYERMMQNGMLHDQLVDAANFAINKSFDTQESICIVPRTVAAFRDLQPMTTNRGPCTGSVASLDNSLPLDQQSVTLSLNHSHEVPAYGYGLMTSISSAVLGLKFAGTQHSFAGDEARIALALLDEANRLTGPNNSPSPRDYHFINRPTMSDNEACLKVLIPDPQHFKIIAPVNLVPDPNDPTKQVAGGGNCDDAFVPGTGYFPEMYPVKAFYQDWIGATSGTLPLGFGGPALFSQGTGDFFGLGRQVYYGSLGWDQQGSILVSIPPSPPNAVYPGDGTLHVPSSFTLRWNDGLSPSQRNPFWPVTYSLYFKLWPYGGTEPSSYTLSGSVSCNPDSTGVCTMPVSGIGNGNYRFYIVANMDASLATGSSNTLSTLSNPVYFTVGNQPISTIPAPLPPNPVYPTDGTMHVPSNLTLRWNDGLDASRRSPFWPVTYAIYYKAWSYNTAEPASYFILGSSFACNPDSSGACTLSFANVAKGNYRWYIVANMDVSQSTGVSPSNLSTQSTVAFFTIGYNDSLSVAWIQPSARSWGPANTLTVAGLATGGIGTVALQWRDVTFNGPLNSVAFQATPDPTSGGWSNTIPSADNCHAFQATAQYTDLSASASYDGVALGYCSFRVIWIQPQSSAGFGPPGSLVVAGSAQGGPPNAQVTLWFRDDTAFSGWTQLGFAPVPDSNGIWYNAIPNVDYTHQYTVYITYDDRNSGNCSYFGNNSATNCP